MQWSSSCRHVRGCLPSQHLCTLLPTGEEDLQQLSHADVARLLLLLMCWVQAAHDTSSVLACGGGGQDTRERPVVTIHCWVHRPGMALHALQELGLTFEHCSCEYCLQAVRP